MTLLLLLFTVAIGTYSFIKLYEHVAVVLYRRKIRKELEKELENL